MEDGIVLWGHRVVIPNKKDLRASLMDELHLTHPGIVKMKLLARSYFWWPAIDKDLEKKSKLCNSCQETPKQPCPTRMHPWEFPDHPWIRIYVDYAAIQGQDVLIVVDAFSKWIEAVRVANATTTSTIIVLRRLFATHGIPETLVSDNGPQFVSEEFAQFLSSNNITHIQTAPKHPSSNGLAERTVQTIKSGIKKMTSGNLELKLQRVLTRYRVTPQATTGKTPSELLYRRRIRTSLYQVRPNVSRKVIIQQSRMLDQGNTKAKQREFQVNDPVWTKNFGPGPTWLKASVTNVLSPTLSELTLEDGRTVRRHNDQVRLRVVSNSDLETGVENVNDNVRGEQSELVLPYQTAYSVEDQSEVSGQTSHAESLEPSPNLLKQVSSQPESSKQASNSAEQVKLRVSDRKRVPSVRLKDYVVYKLRTDLVNLLTLSIVYALH